MKARLRHPFKCSVCGDIFEPHPRNVGRQKICLKPSCKAALKAARDRRWLNKNPDYHRGPIHVARVKAWKQERSHSSSHKAKPQVQDALVAQPIDNPRAVANLTSVPGAETAKVQDALVSQLIDYHGGSDSLAARTAEVQDALTAQDVVLIGIIALLSESTGQGDVLKTREHLLQLGLNFLSGTNVGAIE